MSSVVRRLAEKFEKGQWYERIKFLRTMNNWSIREVVKKMNCN